MKSTLVVDEEEKRTSDEEELGSTVIRQGWDVVTKSTKPVDQGNASGYKHVVVVWLDIAGRDDAWMDISDAKGLKPGRMITSGWLVKESEDHIVIASSLDTQEGLAGNVNAIPRCVIESIQKI